MRPAPPIFATLCIALCLWGAAPIKAHALAPRDICDAAAHRAAANSQVPLPVLLAITRTETARAGYPWPWTVNMEGAGHWFETRAEALAFARAHFDRGARSFDIGCFQINFRWHGQHFASISAMFDPVENARYAADFLTRLYAEMGDWDAAVGAYHSRTEHFAARYLAAYHRHLAALPSGTDRPAPGPSPARVNSFPLLQPGAGSRGAAASLMPANPGPARPLIEAWP